MRLNSIATRIAVTLVLTVVLSFALVVTLSVSGKYLLNRMQGQFDSESHIFASRFLIGVINRHHNPQMISSRIAIFSCLLWQISYGKFHARIKHLSCCRFDGHQV